MISLHVNGKFFETDAEPATPLLWVLREDLGATGTKFGCGVSLCGACTVHVDGRPVRSCVTPISQVGNGHVTTIEGVFQARRDSAATTSDDTSDTSSSASSNPNETSKVFAESRRLLIAGAVRDAWTAHSVAQCGYCQSGMVMAALALLAENASPNDADIDQAFAGHICRCGSYQRLRAAVHAAAEALVDA